MTTPLKVKFADKDKVKALGGKWDMKRKIWYVPCGLDTTPFNTWMHAKDKTKLNCPQYSLFDDWVWDEETFAQLEVLENEAICREALMCMHESASPQTIVKKKRRSIVIDSESEKE